MLLVHLDCWIRLIADGAHASRYHHCGSGDYLATTTQQSTGCRRTRTARQGGEARCGTRDDAVLAEALTLFNPHGSKQNTLFDAVVAALAKRLDADAIFSFDSWYEKRGFRLVAQLYGTQAA